MSHLTVWLAAVLLGGIGLGVAVGSFETRAMFLACGAWQAAVVSYFCRFERAVLPWILLAVAFSAVHLLERADAAATNRLLIQQVKEHFPDQSIFVEGRLRTDAFRAERGVALELEVTRIRLAGPWIHSAGGVRVTVGGERALTLVDQWRAGRLVRMPVTMRQPAVYRNYGVRDERVNLARRGIHFFGSTKSALLVDTLETGSWWQEWGATVRARVRLQIQRSVGNWSGESAAVVTAILIGDRAGLDDKLQRRLQKAGTYHVIAISGGNIAMLVALLVCLMRACGATSRTAMAITIVALLFYSQVVVSGPSVQRAIVMAVIYLGGRVVDVKTRPLNVVSVAVMMLLVADPLDVVDAGFALTFLATLALLVIAPRILSKVTGGEAESAVAPRPPQSRVRRMLRICGMSVLVLVTASLAVEIALLPIATVVFSRVTFAGLLLNLAAIPLMAVIQATGLAVLVLGCVSSTAAAAVGWVAHLSVSGLTRSAKLVEWLPTLSYRLPSTSWIPVVAYYAALIGCVLNVRRPVVRRAAVFSLMGVAVWMLWPPAFSQNGHAGDLVVDFFDVGQGDSTLVRFPDGHALLVDGGGVPGFDLGERVVVPAIWKAGLRHLDWVAMTHAHEDHVGGLPTIIDDLRPRELWEGVPVARDQRRQELLQTTATRRVPWRSLSPPGQLRIGAVDVRVLNPPTPDWERPRVRNDDSLVLSIVYGAVQVLLTGDIGIEAEKAIAAGLASEVDMNRLTILKVPHHGSATSSTDALLDALRPAAAIVSVGRQNRHGHPAPAVVDRYRRRNVVLFRTDVDGQVTLTSDGKRVEVKTFTGRRWTHHVAQAFRPAFVSTQTVAQPFVFAQ